MGDGDITGLSNQGAGPLVPDTADVAAGVPALAAGIRSEAVVASELARHAAKLLAALTREGHYVPVIVSLQARSWPHEVEAPLRLYLPNLRLADNSTFNLVYVDDRTRAAFKIFRLKNYAVYVGELLWSIVVEEMGIMAPGVLRASRFYEGANGKRHPLPVYQMAHAFMPDEGWREIVYPHCNRQRLEIFKELTDYSLPLLHIILDNVRALYANSLCEWHCPI